MKSNVSKGKMEMNWWLGSWPELETLSMEMKHYILQGKVICGLDRGGGGGGGGCITQPV